MGLKFRLGRVHEQEHLDPHWNWGQHLSSTHAGADQVGGVNGARREIPGTTARTFRQIAATEGVSLCVFWVRGWHFILPWAEAIADSLEGLKKSVSLPYNQVLPCGG